MLTLELKNQLIKDSKEAINELKRLESELDKLKSIEKKKELIREKNEVRSMHSLVDYTIPEVLSDYNPITAEMRSSEHEALVFKIRPKIVTCEKLISIQKDKIVKINEELKELYRINKLTSINLLSDYQLIIDGQASTVEEIKNEILKLKSLRIVNKKITLIGFRNVEVGVILQDVINLIKSAPILTSVFFENTFLINSEVKEICDNIVNLNLTTIAFPDNLIDIHYMVSSPLSFKPNIKVDLSGNVLRPDNKFKDSSSAAMDLLAKIPQIIFPQINTKNSYLDTQLTISQDNWLVYLLASKSSFICPSHASIVIEGITEEGLHVFSRAHLAPKLPCTALSGIFFSICNNYDIVVEFLNDNSVKKQISDIKSKNIYCGFQMNKSNAISLLNDISRDCEKIEGSFSLMSIIDSNTENSPLLTCLRWALRRINKYRVLENKPNLTGERPYATVEKYKNYSAEIEMKIIGEHHASI